MDDCNSNFIPDACEIDDRILLAEDWEIWGPSITAVWNAWGDPVAEIHAGTGAEGSSFSLNCNGDTLRASGVASLQRFRLVPGLTVTYYANVHALGEDPGVQQENRVCLSPLDGAAVTDQNWSAPSNLPHIAQFNDLTQQTTYTLGHGQVHYETIQEGGTWVKFAFVFREGGTFDYYRDDGWVASSYPGAAEAYMGERVSLVLAGRSEDTTNLLDQIEITVPGTDCDTNGMPDSCDCTEEPLASSAWCQDCNLNGALRRMRHYHRHIPGCRY